MIFILWDKVRRNRRGMTVKEPLRKWGKEEDQKRKGGKKEKCKAAVRLRPEKDGRRKIRRQQAMDYSRAGGGAEGKKPEMAFLHTAS